MECFRIPESLRSRREVNKKLRKQYICCIHNVHDLVMGRGDGLRHGVVLNRYLIEIIGL